MKQRLTIIAIITGLFASVLAACQGGIQPVEYIVEVPVTRIVEVIVTATPEGNNVGASVAQAAQASAEAEVTEDPEAELTPEVTPEVEATPNPIPTPERLEIFIAEQAFQNGRMFWLRPIDQIWVIGQNEQGSRVWQIFEDNFEDGDLESDPDLLPPVSGLYQPVRGFGKLWREGENLQSQLGWATDSEVGYLGIYEYHYGGTVADDGTFEQAPGYHIIRTESGDVYRFNEGVWTWEIVTNPNE